MEGNIVGSLIFTVPAIVLAWLVLWRQYRPIFWSVLAMIVFVTGYLNATGAARDIAAATIGYTCCGPAVPAR